MLKVSGLTKRKKEGFILNDLSFEVPHGSIAVFLGNSGVGKSTLLRILNNLETYDSGTVTLDDALLDLKKVNQEHTVGMVFQNFNLFENLNVEENITLALTKCKGIEKEQAREMAKKQLQKYGLQDKALESIQKLSGGQKQRLAIARTLVMNPKVICLDEPTSALDPRLTAQVGTIINELAGENRIVLLTTHDTKLLDYLKGHLYLMENGTIVADSDIETCLSQPQTSGKIFHFLSGAE